MFSQDLVKGLFATRACRRIGPSGGHASGSAPGTGWSSDASGCWTMSGPLVFLNSYMNSSAASHRTLALLALVVSASRGLSFSRGKLNETGVICFAVVLGGLAVLLLFRAHWQGSSDSKGGFPTWQVVLPCAYVYIFCMNAGRELLVSSLEDWRPTLRLITWTALVCSLPVLLTVSRRLRDLLQTRGQVALLLLPLLPVAVPFLLVPSVSPAPVIDVFLFETQAARSLLFGLNPYTIDFVNVYSTADLYPTGSPDSYPYPPLSLLFALGGFLLGDVRWSLIACHVAAAVLLAATARKRGLPITEVLTFGTMFLYMPHAPFVSEQAWTDPSVAFGLALFSLLLARRQPQAALWAAGFAIALKQTMVVLPPLLWGLWRRLNRTQLTAIFAISAVTYGLFILWDAEALWNDVVIFHMLTPFRDRAMTLSAYLLYFFEVGPLPSWLSLVGLVVGAATAVRALRADTQQDSPYTSDRVCRFFTGLAFALLLTLVLSKHAFMNYYYLVHFALIAALIWSRITDLEAKPA